MFIPFFSFIHKLVNWLWKPPWKVSVDKATILCGAYFETSKSFNLLLQVSCPEKKLSFLGFNHCYTLLVERLSVSLARFWRRTWVWLLLYAVDLVRSLLSMCCWLLAYSFEPRPNSRALGTESIYNIRMLELKKPVWREETRWTSP